MIDNIGLIYLFLQLIDKSRELLVRKLSNSFFDKPNWNPRGKFDLDFNFSLISTNDFDCLCIDFICPNLAIYTQTPLFCDAN